MRSELSSVSTLRLHDANDPEVSYLMREHVWLYSHVNQCESERHRRAQRARVMRESGSGSHGATLWRVPATSCLGFTCLPRFRSVSARYMLLHLQYIVFAVGETGFCDMNSVPDL
ncbi:hypothetical protein F2P81_025354 [Scophthalmus maximus]|uniref:Uncharacterized protein n=1 Tax=Scophthalmus maximus TaxID=52904 RepID=A0A6A4RKL9_SCOMX|nr:hypothetical protein F2P81_025354 [Scophthalmus maximus]